MSHVVLQVSRTLDFRLDHHPPNLNSLDLGFATQRWLDFWWKTGMFPVWWAIFPIMKPGICFSFHVYPLIRLSALRVCFKIVSTFSFFNSTPQWTLPKLGHYWWSPCHISPLASQGSSPPPVLLWWKRVLNARDGFWWIVGQNLKLIQGPSRPQAPPRWASSVKKPWYQRIGIVLMILLIELEKAQPTRNHQQLAKNGHMRPGPPKGPLWIERISKCGWKY